MFINTQSVRHVLLFAMDCNLKPWTSVDSCFENNQSLGNLKAISTKLLQM